MRAAEHRLVLRERVRAFERVRDSHLLQRFGDAVRPLRASHADRFQPRHHHRRRRIDLQADHVQGRVAPAHRDLHARNQPHTQTARRNRGFCQAVGSVVVRKRDRIDPGAGRQLDQLRGRQQTIRASRMVMQVEVIQGAIISK